MALHEWYGMVKGKLDSKEMNTKTCVVDQSSLPENDFSELVWENGHISMLGQSNITRKIPTFQFHKGHDPKDVGYVNTNTNTNTNATNLRMLRFEGDLDSELNEIKILDEDVLPWLNFGIDDYSSDFLPGITMNDFSLFDKRSVFKDSHTSSSSSSSSHQTSFAFSVKSRVSNITENNASNVVETTQTPSDSSGFSSLRMEKQDPIVSSNSCTIMNFSHFARPASIVKSNLKNIDMGDMNKGNVATRVVLSGECPKETAFHVMEPSKVDFKPFEPKSRELNAAVSEQCNHTCDEDDSKIDRALDLVLGKEHEAVVENRIDPAIASSSVCSGNGAKRCSDDPNQSLKRKSRDTKDSESQSEDPDEESVGVKTTAPARGAIGSKRSRSAEVHNLSERKRRDRINEKMRALQELIPNCNKVDKASMLDEAIEYLKTLQVQVQIMSMGSGLYMPAMMIPLGMQHMQASHVAPFSPMAMQMGYGMRMHENNGGSSRFPMAHVPQIQGTNLVSAHMSGATDLHGMAARSYPQVFGISNPGLSVPMPCSPLLPFQGESLMNQSSLGLNTSATAGLIETVNSVSTSSSLKNPMPNLSSQVMQNTNV
ncbi:putative transcription factor bHLH family [Lupinus albus]|uniref:Putative transcription factor bHLH family n=1 Tax=Lupinus albus TaxID=3870 RepID=A0A6A4P0N0_LUPAL|nr:putative transcription factor bHLH family [Lupinus albus]